MKAWYERKYRGEKRRKKGRKKYISKIKGSAEEEKRKKRMKE